MVPASGARKRPVTESPLEDSLAPPGLTLRPVAKEAVNSKVSKNNTPLTQGMLRHPFSAFWLRSANK